MEAGSTNWALKKIIKDEFGSQITFATRLGAGKKSQVSAVVNSRAKLNTDDLIKWAKYLGMTQKRLKYVIECGKI